MKESTEFLILDTIKKHSSLVPLFSAGYSYAKIIEWVRQLEEEKKICFDNMEKRTLTDIGLGRWKVIKKKKSGFTILPLNDYKISPIRVDVIYLP